MTMLEPRPWSHAKAARSPAHAPEAPSPIDELAKLRQRISELEKREKELEATVKALGPGEHKGSHVVASVTVSERDSLDSTAIKAAMPEAWIRQFSKRTTVTTLRIKPLV